MACAYPFSGYYILNFVVVLNFLKTLFLKFGKLCQLVYYPLPKILIIIFLFKLTIYDGIGIRNYFRSLEASNLVQTWLNFKGFVIVFGSPLYLEVFPW